MSVMVMGIIYLILSIIGYVLLIEVFKKYDTSKLKRDRVFIIVISILSFVSLVLGICALCHINISIG